MKKISFVDQTIRDAQQSLWAYLMSSDMILPIAPVMDEVGYHEIATVGSNGYVVQVRYFGEDPWERLRALAKTITQTPLRGSFMTASLASFDIDTPRDAIALWIKRHVANGIKSFWVCDYQSDMDRFYYFAKIVKEEGTLCIPSLMYTFSPVHTDELWAKKTKLIMEMRDVVDGIMIEDAGGVITPERTKSLITTVKQHCDDIPVEFHSHCTAGLAPLCYLAAIEAGADILHTAVSPLANGTSLPSIENILKNSRRMGYEDDIDDAALEKVSNHFREVAEREGLPIGTPPEYDIYYYEHQVPGGMMTNLKRQLKEMGMEHRLEEFLEEVVRVRKEFGYPVMATPFSQVVGTQAVENVVSGERYKRVLDESFKYVLGHYGEPAGPIDPNVMDRIMSLPEAKKFVNWKPTGRNKSLAELRDEVGHEYSDDEFLLRLLIPGMSAQKGAAQKAGPKKSPPTAGAGKVYAGPSPGLPMALSIEVDGEVFNVKVSASGGNGSEISGDEDRAVKTKQQPREIPSGAIMSTLAGMVVSVKVSEGQQVSKGDVLATVEAMKLIREINSPHNGIVKEIFVEDGEMIEAEDMLMNVEMTHE
jgi:pyruvate/oxaloacetate carboxyltransferase/biotin carboxyl carrier protein